MSVFGKLSGKYAASVSFRYMVRVTFALKVQTT